MAHMSERGGQDHRRREWQSGSQQRPDDGHPSTSSKLSRRDSLSEDNLVRPFSRESISLSSRGSYSVERRWSGDVSDSPSEQGSCSSICLSRSDSLEGWTCPPLPGQVPVEPTETSHGRTAPGAREASPVTKSSTEKPTECRKRKGFRSFLKRLWKALKRPFCCCFHCSSVDVVEPFVPPSDLESEIDPEPSSPAPDRSGVEPYNGQDHRRRERQSGSQQRPDDGHPSTSSKLSRRDSLSEDNLVRPFSRESISLSSRGSYSVEWRWSGDVSDSPSEQGSCSSICLSRSDSLEGWTCPPVPGQVPVEPTETSHGRTAPGAREASPVTKSSTESFESLYYVGKMIGSGTFGSVFEGTRKFDGKKVAIKRIRKLDNFLYLDIPGHPEPLITEVALLLMMRREPISPFVIQLYEWFEHPRKFTLVMEYPEPCESLLDFMDRNPQLDETIARVFMRQAVLAAQHCIEHDVFHNDIHADNFLLKHTLEIKLIDFGCGQLFSSDGYESDVYVGKQDHCPPEVFTDPRFHAVPANVWALGVMLYKMVNACRPFRNRREIRLATVTFQSSNLSRECSDLIRQCLARDPTKRLTLEQMSQHKWIRNDLD